MNLWLSITSNSRLRTDDPFKLTQYPISVLVRTYILLQCLLIKWRDPGPISIQANSFVLASLKRRAGSGIDEVLYTKNHWPRTAISGRANGP